MEYVPPKYGSYVYPTSARIIGWVVVAIITTPMLIQAFYTLAQDDGPLLTVQHDYYHQIIFSYRIFYPSFFSFFPYSFPSAVCQKQYTVKPVLVTTL